jgi:hypothetical protein
MVVIEPSVSGPLAHARSIHGRTCRNHVIRAAPIANGTGKANVDEVDDDARQRVEEQRAEGKAAGHGHDVAGEHRRLRLSLAEPLDDRQHSHALLVEKVLKPIALADHRTTHTPTLGQRVTPPSPCSA